MAYVHSNAQIANICSQRLWSSIEMNDMKTFGVYITKDFQISVCSEIFQRHSESD